MKKTLKRMAELKEEMRAILDTAETEKRGLTDEEKTLFDSQKAELDTLQVQYQRSLLGNAAQDPQPEVDIRSVFAENASKAVLSNTQMTIDVRSDIALITSESVADTIPILYRDILEALEPALILDQLGIKMQTNVQGEPLWPTVAGVEATIQGENTEVADSELEFGKLTAAPKRLAISIPVSRRAFNQTNLNLYGIVVRQIGLAVARTLNKWIVQPSAVAGTQGGVFTKSTVDVSFAGAKPTFAEIVSLETKPLDANVVADGGGAYIVSPSMAGLLKSTPIEAGSPKMILENGEMNGYRVIITNLIPRGCVGFGFFSYACLSEFGVSQLIIDPYTGAKKNLVNFVLNGDFDFTKLRPEAFAIGATKAVAGTLFTKTKTQG